MTVNVVASAMSTEDIGIWTDYLMDPTRVLREVSCPSRLPELLTVAHMNEETWIPYQYAEADGDMIVVLLFLDLQVPKTLGFVPKSRPYC